MKMDKSTANILFGLLFKTIGFNNRPAELGLSETLRVSKGSSLYFYDTAEYDDGVVLQRQMMFNYGVSIEKMTYNDISMHFSMIETNQLNGKITVSTFSDYVSMRTFLIEKFAAEVDQQLLKGLMRIEKQLKLLTSDTDVKGFAHMKELTGLPTHI